MKYDFTTVLDRKGKDAIAIDMPANGIGSYAGLKVKEGFDLIPMWVADMYFATAPSIQEAIQKRLEHPTFGYYTPRKEYYDAITKWHKHYFNTDVTETEIAYENGVLGGVISAMNVLASKGDNVLLHSPTYIGFTMVLENNGYNIVHSPLYKDEEGIWRMDYEDMEKKIVENHIHVAIFCSPHNPCGRVWEKEEIEKAMAVYAKHNVYVISDEIWANLIINNHKHIPTQSINDWAKENVVSFYAPSKTFNLAGLIGSYRVVYNEWLRDRLNKEESISHYNSMNVLSMYALIGAYSDIGQEWLEELKTVLSENANYAYDFITKNWDGISVSQPQGTYMLFLDCSKWLEDHNLTMEELLKKGWEYGIIWQDGAQFQSPTSIRLNLAHPTKRIQEAFQRLDQYVINASK